MFSSPGEGLRVACLWLVLYAIVALVIAGALIAAATIAAIAAGSIR